MEGLYEHERLSFLDVIAWGGFMGGSKFKSQCGQKKKEKKKINKVGEP